MNEKIKSLALEASIHFDDNKQSRIHFVNTDTLEKFAELVIKETLQVARAGLEYGPSMDEVVYGYFGIKE